MRFRNKRDLVIYTGSNLFCKNGFSNVRVIRAQRTNIGRCAPRVSAIIIYLRVANVFARLYRGRTTILIESCMSGMREEWSVKEEKISSRGRLIKITKSAYRVSCRPSIYSPLFEIHDGRAAVSLSFNKTSRQNEARITREALRKK